MSDRQRKRDPLWQIVSKPGSRSTGFGRYAWEIERGRGVTGLEVCSARHHTFRTMEVDEAFSRRYDLNADTRYVLFVGSADPRDDLSTLLRAVTLVREKLRDAEPIKIGDPAFYNRRRLNLELCSELNIENAVHWIDDMPETDLPTFCNLPHDFPFSSRFEGFGLPVLEAPAESVAGQLAVPRNPDAPTKNAAHFSWERTVREPMSGYERTVCETGRAGKGQE